MRAIARILVILVLCGACAVATAQALPHMAFTFIRWVADDLDWIFYLLCVGVIAGGGLIYLRKRLAGEALIAASFVALAFFVTTALSVAPP